MTNGGDEGSFGWAALKWVLLGLGALALFGVVMKLIVPVLLIAGVVGVGAAVYAGAMKNKKLGAGVEVGKTLSAKSEPDPKRAQAELEAIKKKLGKNGKESA